MKYLLTLTLLLALVACGEPVENQNEEGTSAESGAGSDWIHDDLDTALALSAETGKPVFIDLYADWCGPCRMLSDDYFSRADYQEELSQCILLKINVDNNPDLAQRYRAQSIPTLIIADAEGNEIDRITGVGGSPEDFLPVISAFIDKGM